MLVEFENQNNKIIVSRDGPWHFDKCLILVKDFDGAQKVKNICMNEASFWVWVHDISLMARNEYGKMEWEEFMRIRVSIDITKPLLWQKKLNFGLPEHVWVSFFYQRLLIFAIIVGY